VGRHLPLVGRPAYRLSPEIVAVLGELRSAVVAEGRDLARHCPRTAHALEELFRLVRAGSR
jgi:hypothetical protein